MNKLLKSLIWPLGITGLSLLIIGLIAVTAPNMNIPTLILYLGVIFLMVGGMQILLAVLLKKSLNNWGALLTMGIAFTLAGATLFYKADAASVYFEYFISIWAITTGAIQLFLAFQNPKAKLLLLSTGILSLIIGAIMFFSDNTTNLQFLFGFYTLLLSITLLIWVYKIIRMKLPQADGNGSELQNKHNNGICQ
jgi:uncharacterized membrane protein HdeD (DUF308 family)